MRSQAAHGVGHPRPRIIAMDARPSRAASHRSYDDRYGGQGYDDGYGDEYSGQQPAPRQGYDRRMPQDESAWYQQVGTRARGMQQRWGETLNSLRIPGIRPQEEGADGKSSSRRVVTTVVLLLVLAGALVAGIVVVGPRVLEKLHPSATSSNSSLCVPSGRGDRWRCTNARLPLQAVHQFTLTLWHELSRNMDR